MPRHPEDDLRKIESEFGMEPGSIKKMADERWSLRKTWLDRWFQIIPILAICSVIFAGLGKYWIALYIAVATLGSLAIVFLIVLLIAAVTHDDLDLED